MFSTRVQIFSIIITGAMFLFVFELVRRKRLQERYALLWLMSAAILLGFSVWKGALNEFASTIGIFYAPSAFFVVALGAILVMLLHFSLVISGLASQNKVLAQRMAALQSRVEELESGPPLADAELSPPRERITPVR